MPLPRKEFAKHAKREKEGRQSMGKELQKLAGARGVEAAKKSAGPIAKDHAAGLKKSADTSLKNARRSGEREAYDNAGKTREERRAMLDKKYNRS